MLGPQVGYLGLTTALLVCTWTLFFILIIPMLNYQMPFLKYIITLNCAFNLALFVNTAATVSSQVASIQISIFGA